MHFGDLSFNVEYGLPHTRGQLYCMVEDLNIYSFMWHNDTDMTGLWRSWWNVNILEQHLIRRCCLDSIFHSETFKETDLDRLIFQISCLLCSWTLLSSNESSSVVTTESWFVMQIWSCFVSPMYRFKQYFSWHWMVCYAALHALNAGSVWVQHMTGKSFSRWQHKSIYLELLWWDIQHVQGNWKQRVSNNVSHQPI